MCKEHLLSDTQLPLACSRHSVSKQSTIVNSTVSSLPCFFTPLLLLCCLLFCSVFITDN